MDFKYSELVPEPDSGRVYRCERKVRLADVGVDGRVRLDAMARYMQDVASDDVADARAEDESYTWVVRRTLIDIVSPFGADRTVALATWASGSGSHWAARRTSITGDAGGCAQAESIWVLIDRVGSRLARLPPAFEEIYGASTQGRRVSARLELPPEPASGAERVSWPLRAADIDTLGHANNAVYWAAIETALAMEHDGAGVLAGSRLRAILEYRRPVDLTSALILAVAESNKALLVWFLDSGETAATAKVSRLTG
jgi:acyl-ACP thioesterase